MEASSSGSPGPRLTVVVRYPEAAKTFGSPQKATLWRAVGRLFGQYHTLDRHFSSTLTWFSIPTDEADERVTAVFAAAGIARIIAIRPGGASVMEMDRR